MGENARFLITGQSQCLIAEQGADGLIHLVYWGPKDNAEMAVPAQFQRLPASPDVPVGPTLMPEHGHGFHGITQVDGFCSHSQKRTRLSGWACSQAENVLHITARDPDLGLKVHSQFRFVGDALIIAAHIKNEGASPLQITRAASALLSTPDWASEVLTYHGAWAREGQPDRRSWQSGRIEQVGRGGRPGFDGGPTLTVCAGDTSEIHGSTLIAHLAWSGPFRLAVERAGDGSGQIALERLFAPGECALAPGEMLDLPDSVLSLSHSGFSAASSVLHDYVRAHSRALERPVHFNTWEARYFDVNEADCIALAQQAAALGAERFVLDDGWFKGRRNDETSLGDWTVDPTQFPNGLGPLIDAVHGLGMSFGLWVEPEMVSPDSDLYRAHPDWVLGSPQAKLPTGRNQLVLDLEKPEVQAFVYQQITSLLDAYPIDYLKWDCNRDLYPATRDGVVRAGAQSDALYQLLDRIRVDYNVEIESCASGGGRIDMGISTRVDRFWASDTTDAMDRIAVQRAASWIMPMEKLGAHIGPSPNPMTGRMVPMGFRAQVALFGHFGIEADPDGFDAQDRETLSRAIAFYKTNRDWVLPGRLIRLGQVPDVQIVVSNDGNRALMRILRVKTPGRPLQPRIKWAGLDPSEHYKLSEFSFEADQMDWPLGEYRGAGLMSEGLHLDPGRALTGRLIMAERIS